MIFNDNNRNEYGWTKFPTELDPESMAPAQPESGLFERAWLVARERRLESDRSVEIGIQND